MSDSPTNTPHNDQPSTPAKWSPSQTPQVPARAQEVVDTEIAALENHILFLGSKNLMNHVEWHEEGRIERLVLKSEGNEGNEDDVKEEAVFQIIAKISADEGFWLDQTGGWTGKFGDLYKSKANCQLIAPTPSHLDYWQKVTNVTSRLMQDRRTKQGEIRNGLLTNTPGLHVRHAIFEAVDYETYKARTHDLYNVDKRLLMSNWSCSTTKAQRELGTLIWHNNEDNPTATRHFGNPIPIFYHDKTRLVPSDPKYSEKLRSTIVKMGVSITYEFMSGKEPVNDFYAEIRYIIILKKPPAASKAPFKRSLDFPGVATSSAASSAGSSSKRTRA